MDCESPRKTRAGTLKRKAAEVPTPDLLPSSARSVKSPKIEAEPSPSKPEEIPTAGDFGNLHNHHRQHIARMAALVESWATETPEAPKDTFGFQMMMKVRRERDAETNRLAAYVGFPMAENENVGKLALTMFLDKFLFLAHDQLAK